MIVVIIIPDVTVVAIIPVVTVTIAGPHFAPGLGSGSGSGQALHLRKGACSALSGMLLRREES